MTSPVKATALHDTSCAEDPTHSCTSATAVEEEDTRYIIGNKRDGEDESVAITVKDKSNDNPQKVRRASRTIDDFYETAHDHFEWREPRAHSIISFLEKRSSYHMCYLALGVVNVGSSASMTCISYLFASNTNFEEVAQEKDGLIAVANFLGALFGGLLAGPISDISGRRKVLLVALAIMSIFSVLTAFANAPWSVILCRFLTGLGIGAGLPCVSALVAEHSSSNYRGFYSNYADSMWTVGFIYGAFLAWLFLDGQDKVWRVVFLLGISAPNVMGMVLVYLFVPESFRFLAIRGQHEEAAKVANRIARSLSFGGAPLEMTEVSEHYPAKSIHGSQPTLLASWTEAKDAYAELYRTPENRRKILTAQAIWFLIHIGYGVAQWVSRLFQELEVVDNVFLNALIFSIGAVPGLILAGVAVERVSRNLFLKGSIFATLASIATFTILSYTSNSAGAIVAMSAIFHSCLMASWAAISLVTTEAFNTTQRSAALGMCLASGMLGVAFMNGLSALVLRAENPIVLLLVGSTGMILIVFAIYSRNLKVREKGEVLEDA